MSAALGHLVSESDRWPDEFYNLVIESYQVNFTILICQ